MRRFAIASLVLAGIVCCQQPLRAQQGPAVVEVTTVEQKSIAPHKTFIGIVEPYRSSVIGSAVDGRVVHLHMREGQFVKANEPIGQLRMRTIELEVAAAKAQLRFLQETLNEQVNGALPEELEQAQAAALAAQANVAYQEANVKRLLRLRHTSRNVVTEEEIEEAQSLSEQARQALAQADAAYRLLKKGPRDERIAQARANVDVQQQQVDLLEDRLQRHTVTAPFDAFITEEHAHAGQWVKQGDPVVSIVDLGVVHIVVDLPEQYVGDVHPGAIAVIQFEALKQDVIERPISQIVPLANPQGRTFPIKVKIDNAFDPQGQPVIKAGMLAQVTLPIGQSHTALIVPKDAIVLGGATPQVVVVASDPNNSKQLTARPVLVRLGITSASEVEVIGNVQAGARVVVRGNERLRPGQELRIQPSP